MKLVMLIINDFSTKILPALLKILLTTILLISLSSPSIWVLDEVYSGIPVLNIFNFDGEVSFIDRLLESTPEQERTYTKLALKWFEVSLSSPIAYIACAFLGLLAIVFVLSPGLIVLAVILLLFFTVISFIGYIESLKYRLQNHNDVSR